jgi:arylsulfatase A-like enzyme
LKIQLKNWINHSILEKTGEYKDTIIVVTGDHGMSFLRGKGRLISGRYTRLPHPS